MRNLTSLFLLFNLLMLYSGKEELPKNGVLGIDVSEWDGRIDWAKVKNAGIKYAILRGTVKDESTDPTFEYNYKGAIENGIDVSVYKFSYALTVEKAEQDLDNLMLLLNGRVMPVYIDLEWDKQGELGKDAVTEIAVAWVKKCQSYGYECGVYSNTNWYKNYYYPERLQELGCKFWIAQYGKNTGEYDEKYKPNVGEYIWQYTSRGKVDGIPEASDGVDMNMMY